MRAHEFIPVETFTDKELKSVYVKGKHYAIRKGSPKLSAKIETWLSEGKITLAFFDAGSRRVRGTGDVK